MIAAAGKILLLWSVPRARSTAFFRMMIQRGDVVAVHEPFSTLAEHGAAEVAGRRVCTEQAVIDALTALPPHRRVFVKDTTDEEYPVVLADPEFLRSRAHSAFLVRDPAETIPSYYAVNPRVRRDQIGFDHLERLFLRVRELTGRTPLVIDAADLVADPSGTAARYCADAGIAFVPAAMSWAAGDRPEWRATGRWHLDVARTTGFENRSPRHGVALDDVPHLRAYLDHHTPVYRRLRRHCPTGPIATAGRP
ncbi:hypothetical protein ABNF97_23790 [Plantactinospora sp. B6F1]|uniref:sulfotransferase-like domain-containing protein n=1 Tax=Plantactinospora sp. B6F1 TaxID=3158971 RepID=UPI0010DAD698